MTDGPQEGSSGSSTPFPSPRCGRLVVTWGPGRGSDSSGCGVNTSGGARSREAGSGSIARDTASASGGGVLLGHGKRVCGFFFWARKSFFLAADLQFFLALEKHFSEQST